MFFKLYGFALALFLFIDALWLGLIAKNLYQAELGHLIAKQINWTAAAFFYLIYTGGITLFVLLPSLHQESFCFALLYGAAFGFVAYATYDLTNLATIEGFPFKIVIWDLLWGSFITSFTSLVTWKVFS